MPHGLTDLEWNVLRASNGEVVQLPYNDFQRVAEQQLIAAGLIASTMEDDQPTTYATLKGRMLLASK